MGGDAFTIPILDPPEPPAPAAWKQWLGVRRPEWQTIETRTQISRSRDAPDLARALTTEWIAWLRGRLEPPSESSAIVLRYLSDIPVRISLRGLRGKSEPDFSHWIQFSFSGCAGMAQTSASVSAHWADCWYRQEHAAISDRILRPAGITNRPPGNDETAYPLFMPAGSLGYIACEVLDDAERRLECAVDESLALAHDGDERLDRLDALAAPLMADRRCRCQLCDV